jgi:hypothetical protein
VSKWDFDSRLSDLIDQQAIKEENGYLVGNKERFDTMLEMKHTRTQLNP